MAKRAFIGAHFYDLSYYTGEQRVFLLTSSTHAVLKYREFDEQIDDILHALKEEPYHYIEPEDSTQHN